MSQAEHGAGYSLQSFLEKNQKRISTSIPHANNKAILGRLNAKVF